MFKSLFLAGILSFTSLTGFAATTPSPPTPAPTTNQKVMKILSGNYEIDSPHTHVAFTIPHFVISEVQGRFDDVSGNFTIGKTFLDSKFTATAQVASIDTGVKQRDDHLRSAEFFDAEKFPVITFSSKTITGTYDNFKMVAAVTIKGITRDVLFSGAYKGGIIKDSFGKQRVALKATGKVNRRDFNINYDGKFDLGPVVGDDVEITIITEGVKI